MFSLPSYAGLTKISENVDGDIYYVDFERIRKHDGYVYFWRLRDYLKPDKFGDLSSQIYNQVDCKLFRKKTLSYSFHKEPMGGGPGEVSQPIGDNENWVYPTPKSVNEEILKEVCNR